MKITRHKKLQRFLSFYKNNFNFRPPYQIILDGTFCQSALSYKVNLQEQMPKYFDCEVKMCTTTCVVTETEKLGPLLYGAMLIVKQYPVRKCGHEDNPISGSKCIKDTIKNGNPNHYIIATQDQELADLARSVPGVPLLYLNFNAIIMEKPSQMSSATAVDAANKTSTPTDYQLNIIKSLKKEILGEEPVKKKKRKIKGPNSLSCKKSQKKNKVQKDNENKKRKRHKRIKIAKHVKEAFQL